MGFGKWAEVLIKACQQFLSQLVNPFPSPVNVSVSVRVRPSRLYVLRASLIFFDAVFDAITSAPMRGSHVEPPRVRSGLFLEHSSPLTDPSPEACLSAGSMVSWADGTETSGARLHGWAACTLRSAQASRRRVPAELDLATSVAAEVGDHHHQVLDGHSGTRQRYRRVVTRP